jgi:hypothetical protein
MTIVAGVVIGGAPVTANARANLRGKDKKRRKKRTCIIVWQMEGE